MLRHAGSVRPSWPFLRHCVVAILGLTRLGRQPSCPAARTGGHMARFVGAIDQGTTSTRFMVFDRTGAVIAMAQREHRQIYPRPGWVEHDPLEIRDATFAVIAEALRGAGLT